MALSLLINVYRLAYYIRTITTERSVKVRRSRNRSSSATAISYLLITRSQTVNDAANEFHAGEKKVRCYNLPFLSSFRLFIPAAWFAAYLSRCQLGRVGLRNCALRAEKRRNRATAMRTARRSAAGASLEIVRAEMVVKKNSTRPVEEKRDGVGERERKRKCAFVRLSRVRLDSSQRTRQALRTIFDAYRIHSDNDDAPFFLLLRRVTLPPCCVLPSYPTFLLSSRGSQSLSCFRPPRPNRLVKRLFLSSATVPPRRSLPILRFFLCAPCGLRAALRDRTRAAALSPDGKRPDALSRTYGKVREETLSNTRGKMSFLTKLLGPCRSLIFLPSGFRLVLSEERHW